MVPKGDPRTAAEEQICAKKVTGGRKGGREMVKIGRLFLSFEQVANTGSSL